MKLPSGEKVSPVMTVRCCLKEGGKHKTGEGKEQTNQLPENRSNVECNMVRNPGEQSDQVQDPTMLTPPAAQDNQHSNFMEN